MLESAGLGDPCPAKQQGAAAHGRWACSAGLGATGRSLARRSSGPALDAPPTCRASGPGRVGGAAAAAVLVACGRDTPGSDRPVRPKVTSGGGKEDGPPCPQRCPQPPLPEGLALRRAAGPVRVGLSSPPPLRPRRPRVCGPSSLSQALRPAASTPGLLSLSSTPSPRAAGGPGGIRGAGPRPNPQHPKGRGLRRGMEAGRADTERAGCPRRPGLWGAGLKAPESPAPQAGRELPGARRGGRRGSWP